MGRVGHATEYLLGVGHVLHVRHNIARGQGSFSWVLLKAFHTFEVNNELDDVQALFVLVSDASGPIDEFRLETRLGNVFDDRNILLVRCIREVLVHLLLEGTVLMPPSPDACRRGQIFRHLELLLVLEFLMDSRPASELPVFHQIRHVHDSFVVVLDYF